MGIFMRESHRIIKNKGSISVTNTTQYRVDTTIGRAENKAGKGDSKSKKTVEIHKDRCNCVGGCNSCPLM